MTPIETPQGDRNEGYSHVTRLIKPLVLTFWFPMLGGLVALVGLVACVTRWNEKSN